MKNTPRRKNIKTKENVKSKENLPFVNKADNTLEEKL